MNKETFNQELKKLNIELTPKQETNLEKYYNLLVETNQTTNLTRITNKKEVYLKHFYDSLTITKVITSSTFKSKNNRYRIRRRLSRISTKNNL